MTLTSTATRGIPTAPAPLARGGGEPRARLPLKESRNACTRPILTDRASPATEAASAAEARASAAATARATVAVLREVTDGSSTRSCGCSDGTSMKAAGSVEADTTPVAVLGCGLCE